MRPTVQQKGAALLLGFGLCTAQVFGAPVLDRAFLSYDRVQLFGLDQQAKLDQALVAGQNQPFNGLAGSFDYDFQVPTAGWHEILIAGVASDLEYLVDPPPGDPAPTFIGANAIRQGVSKVGNLWLSAGPHTLRLQRRVWYGFGTVTQVKVQPVDGQSLSKTLRIEPGARRFYKSGACGPLLVSSQGRDSAATLTVNVAQPDGQSEALALNVGAGTGLQQQTIDLPCDQAGRHTVTFAEQGHAIDSYDLRSLTYDVVDVSEPLPPVLNAPATLVEELDPLAREPDFGSGSTLVQQGGLSYRESGDRGWIPWQRQTAEQRAQLPEPSWFGYQLQPLTPQQAYRIEVDLPDNAERGLAVVLRENNQVIYPMSIGADTGTVFGLSGQNKTLVFPFWPRGPNARLVVMNALDGQRAAINGIRVYSVDDYSAPPLPPKPAVRTRQYVSWYEEGQNFAGPYGGADRSFDASIPAVDRWAQLVRDVGGTTLKPAVAVYQMSLYPSRWDTVFGAGPDNDLLRRMLLAAEQNGLQLIAEIAPEARQLDYPYDKTPAPKPHLLVNKNGGTQAGLYNLRFAANQDWLNGMVGELAALYHDSPAFDGIDVRLMTWANHGLNNYVSLDWGYDDLNVTSFNTDRHANMPETLLLPMKPDGVLAKQRYDWLMANAREAWIDWRCEQVAKLYQRLRNTVSSMGSSNLRLYTSVFAWSDTASVTALREAGIDPVRLSAIDGLKLVNAQFSYGRREPDAAVNNREQQRLTDPASQQLLAPVSGYHLAGAGYFEATDSVVPPVQLGFDPATPTTWSSTAGSPVATNSLARLAIPLARGDAQMLGDGGNMFTFGQPDVLRNFLFDYRNLPEVPFTLRSGPSDAVALWSHPADQSTGGGDGEWLYLVNATNQLQSRTLTFTGQGRLLRVRTSSLVRTNPQSLTFSLQPYQLMVFRSSGTLRVN